MKLFVVKQDIGFVHFIIVASFYCCLPYGSYSVAKHSNKETELNQIIIIIIISKAASFLFYIESFIVHHLITTRVYMS
jgi:hypothetical protein